MRNETVRFTNEKLMGLVAELNKATVNRSANDITKAQKAVEEELKKHNKALKDARYAHILTLDEPMFEFLKCGLIPRTKLKNAAKKDELPKYELDDGYAKANLFDFIKESKGKAGVCSDYDKAITRLWYNFNIFSSRESEMEDKCENSSFDIPWNLQDVLLGLPKEPEKFTKTNLAKQLDYVINEILLPNHKEHIKATNIDVTHICMVAYGVGANLATIKRPKVDGMFATALLSACYKLTNNTKYELVDR